MDLSQLAIRILMRALIPTQRVKKFLLMNIKLYDLYPNPTM